MFKPIHYRELCMWNQLYSRLDSLVSSLSCTRIINITGRSPQIWTGGWTSLRSGVDKQDFKSLTGIQFYALIDILKFSVERDLTPCTLVNRYRRFERIHYLHLQCICGLHGVTPTTPRRNRHETIKPGISMIRIEPGTFKVGGVTAVPNRTVNVAWTPISNFDICRNCNAAVSWKTNTRMQ
jgi:hypothetical protein